MIVDHDAHVHTILSHCNHDPEATAANLVAQAAAAGLATLGFADHLWDSAVPGASEWYRPQDVEYVLQTRRLLPADACGVRVLVGCETEYCGGGKVGLSRAAAERFDFVLLPFTHFHMRGFVAPADIDSPREVAALMADRCREVADLGFGTGLAHPFYPFDFSDYADEILRCLSDGELLDCFGRAARAGLSAEINVCMFPGAAGQARRGFHDETFLRVLALAKQAGCRFHFGSDAHTVAQLDAVLRLGSYASRAGIGPADILPLFRPAGTRRARGPAAPGPGDDPAGAQT
jgi:histidinol phosphatase-like PHP family hydrolase